MMHQLLAQLARNKTREGGGRCRGGGGSFQQGPTCAPFFLLVYSLVRLSLQLMSEPFNSIHGPSFVHETALMTNNENVKLKHMFIVSGVNVALAQLATAFRQ